MRIHAPKKMIFIIGLSALLLASIFWIVPQKPALRFHIGNSLVDAYRDCIGGARSQQDKGVCLKDLGDHTGKNATAAEIDTVIMSFDLPQSLRHCDALSSAHTGECYTGAFMENLQSKQVGRFGTHPSAYMPKPNDPNYPCNLLDEKHKDFCYRYTGIAVVVQTKGDFKKAFEYCLKVAPAYQDTCFFGVGTDIPAPQWTSREAGQKCGVALEVSDKAYTQCILGGMAFLVQLNLGSPQAVNEFCGAIEPEYRDLCFQTAGANFRGWVSSDEEHAEKCNQLASARARWLCLK